MCCFHPEPWGFMIQFDLHAHIFCSEGLLQPATTSSCCFRFFSPKARLVEGTPHLFGFHTVLPFTRAFSAASPGEMTLVEQIGLCLGDPAPGKKESIRFKTP